MNKICDFYLEKGSEFLAEIDLIGTDSNPLPITDCEFFLSAFCEMDDRKTINIPCLTENADKGIILIYLSAEETIKMHSGLWHFNFDITFEGFRKLRVLSGHLIVKDEKRC